MEVATSIASTLVIVACVALLFLILRHVTAQRASQIDERAQEASFLVSSSSIRVNEPQPSEVEFPASALSLEGFVCQYVPVEQELHVYSKIALLAPCVSSVHVHNGGHVLILETTVGSVSVRQGGRAVLYGLVVGNVLNEGGEIHLFGRVLGSLVENAGFTRVYAGAVVTNAL